MSSGTSMPRMQTLGFRRFPSKNITHVRSAFCAGRRENRKMKRILATATFAVVFAILTGIAYLEQLRYHESTTVAQHPSDSTSIAGQQELVTVDAASAQFDTKVSPKTSPHKYKKHLQLVVVFHTQLSPWQRWKATCPAIASSCVSLDVGKTYRIEALPSPTKTEQRVMFYSALSDPILENTIYTIDWQEQVLTPKPQDN